ncbi:glycosyltransferase [Pseudonocardia sp. Ae707_Ps2]
MSQVISVVTAVDPTRSEHLPETWKALQVQKLPEGWEWEWLVQCDGRDADSQRTVMSSIPVEDPRISYGASRKSGVAITRTMTLARARGSLVKTLDADDRLTAGALERDISAHSDPEISWSAARVIDEHMDGTRSEHYPWNPPPGRIEIGQARDAYADNFRILVHPATLCIRYRLLVALGGWMSLPASEDTALLMALNGCRVGWFSDEPGMIYRRWPEQMSASGDHADPEELAIRRHLVRTRSEAVQDEFLTVS